MITFTEVCGSADVADSLLGTHGGLPKPGQGIAMVLRSPGTAYIRTTFEDYVWLCGRRADGSVASWGGAAAAAPGTDYLADGDGACALPQIALLSHQLGSFKGRLALRQVGHIQYVRVDGTGRAKTGVLSGIRGQHVHDCGVAKAVHARNASAGCIVTSESLQAYLSGVPDVNLWTLVVVDSTAINELVAQTKGMRNFTA